MAPSTFRRLLSLAPLAAGAGAVLLQEQGPAAGKILFATMTFPEDTLPLDITVAHQARMVSNDRKNVETVIIDNRPPWMSPESVQEDILQMMQQTGMAQIRKVDYAKTYNSPKYLQGFFKTGDPSNTTKTLEGAHDKSDISGKHMSSNTLGMFVFLEHCLEAVDVEMCIFVDPDIILYREGEDSLASLARKAFKQSEKLIALNPPTICNFDNASVSGDEVDLKRVGLLSQRYLILHRERLIKALPLPVPHSEFDVNFEHLFHRGMQLTGYHAARRIASGRAFAIHPFSARWAHCRNKHANLHIVKHALLCGADLAGHKNEEADEKGHFGFSTNLADGLTEMFRRVEAGKIPRAILSGEEPWSATNQCEDMCVDKQRIADGFAW